MISADDYLYFVRRAVDEMKVILAELGDDIANRRPDLPGANSPYAIATHCAGVADFWAGQLVAGRAVERDRDAEFVARGSVADVVARLDRALAQLERDVAVADPEAPLCARPPASFLGPDRPLTQGGALQHVYEELAQHLGQLQLTRDLLVAEAGRT